MANSFELYIKPYSPSIALRLFGELVLPGGGDNYEITKNDGAYVLCSRYISEWENERIQERAGMNLRTCVSCSIIRPREVDAIDIIQRLIAHVYREITHDFLLLENGEDIILMRKDWNALVNTGAERRFDIDLYDREHEIRELPKLNLKEENPNGNDMDNRN